jgi:nucleotide-binding universal stress UspA family protein
VEAVSRVEYIYYWEEAARAIRDIAMERHVESIVMASHGRGGLGRWLWGSVSDMVMRTTQTPLILVPAACESVWPTDRAPRILVPLDGSSLAEQTLGPAAALAESLQAELHLLRVVEVVDAVYPAYGGVIAMLPIDVPAELAEARRYLEGIAASLRRAGREVTVLTGTGHPAATIADVVSEQDIDLIALATHGRGGFARLVLGSVATATLERATVPLLLIRPTQSAQQAAAPEPAAATAHPSPGMSAPPAAGTTATLAVTPRELDLLHRGLGELLYAPARDARLAEPVRALMAKLKEVGPSPAAGRTAATRT